jgi:hypothetical protein
MVELINEVEHKEIYSGRHARIYTPRKCLPRLLVRLVHFMNVVNLHVHLVHFMNVMNLDPAKPRAFLSADPANPWSQVRS